MNFHRYFFVLLGLLLTIYQPPQADADTVYGPSKCSPLNEFKQVHSYLKNQAGIELSETQVLKQSLLVTEGCRGSAQRFKRVYQTLEKSGVDIKKSIETALLMAKSSDAQADIFLATFKGLFLENKYDFTFEESFLWAQEYAQAPESQHSLLKADFSQILNFCTSQNAEILPIKSCREYSLQLLKIATRPDRKSIYPQFKKLYDFLNEKEGPRFPIEQNLNICLQVLDIGDSAVHDFIEAYRYANSKTGLDLNTLQAFKFALEISKNSEPKK
ncbi:MAG: hypothetical protein ACLGGX_11155 [Bdellovibrionia bacterium]